MKNQGPKRTDTPQPRVNLHVLGSAGNVTGSLLLFEVFDRQKTIRFLLEVGLHQEDDTINRSHRLPDGIRACDIDFVIISHAHIDHSGYLPKLIKDGFRGVAYTHPATLDLLKFLLPDSGRLQESAARRETQKLRSAQRGTKSGAGRRLPTVRPTYTEKDARKSLRRIQSVHYDRPQRLADCITVKFTEASHILGAAVVTLSIGYGKGKKTFCFTGNIGRNGMPFLKNLAPVLDADFIMTESTYGNKLHEKRDRLQVLANIINEAYRRARRCDRVHGCGTIVIPAFAVGRVQTVLYDLRELITAGRIPNIPVFLDSPMAIASTKVHRKHKSLYNKAARKLVEKGIDPFRTPQYAECKTMEESKTLNGPANEPVIIIGSSGMAAGGRILSHIERKLDRKENTVLFVGYQGTGALGYTLVNEKPQTVRIRKRKIAVAAKIEYMSDYSGHADYLEIIAWLKKFRRQPKKLFLVHGEPEALSALKGHVEGALPGWNVVVPQPRNCFRLS